MKQISKKRHNLKKICVKCGQNYDLKVMNFHILVF